MTKKTGEPINLEAKLEEFESIVKKMESRQLTIEESLSLFEQGVHLTNICQKALVCAEQKVQQLIQSEKQSMLSDFNSEN